ncbi:uncharacterized protein LOC124276538 isoform X2 [Haliotis rubra]|uniref:uncharacterized protein LOC124276538 isoform X2 n=1 Tax=Haliotis rubra TaxID=36100 RepID=UPI001EE592C2|nr:uncharacterized protein LOC124276538 isoform X2 [Haliotis rubra]
MATGGDDSDTEVDADLDTSSDVQNKTEHYDVALLFAENDKNQALEILEQMEEITVENGEKPKVCLYTDLPGASAHTEAGRNLTKVATLILVLATENLQDEEVAKLIKDEAIGNTRLASKCHPGLKYCVRPLYLDKERKAHPPSGLSTIQEVRWYDKDSRCGQRDIRMLLQNHIQYRKQREREDSRQRTVRDTSCSRLPKDSTDNINLAVSIEPAHQQRQVLERDIPIERTHLDRSAAVRPSPICHREQENMATTTPEVGQQSLDSINLQTNGSSVLFRRTNESSDARAPGHSASERNNHQPSDSTMAQRNNNAAYVMNPAQRSDFSRESYLSQDEASSIRDSSPTMNTAESNCSQDADSERNHELQFSGSREEQGSGTRNPYPGTEFETDQGSMLESDLAQISLTTDSQHTTDQISTRKASSDSEPAKNYVSTSITGKDTEFTQTTESLLVGGNGKQLTGHPLEGIEHETMTETVLKHTGQAHRPTAICAAPNDLVFGGGEKVAEPNGVAAPRVVHYHTHFHGEGPGLSQGGPPQWGLPVPLNVVRCGNVQIGSGQQIIRGIQTIPNTSDDVQSDAPTTINPEGSPPPYSVDDPNQRREHLRYGVRHDLPPESISDGSDETTTKQVFNSDEDLQDEQVSEKMKPQNEESNTDWFQENEPVNTDGGSCSPSLGDDSGFVDPRVQSPGTSTSDENSPSETSGGWRTDLTSMESVLGQGDDLPQMIPDSGDEDGDVGDASDTGETRTPRFVRNNLGQDRATPPLNTLIVPPNEFRNKDSRRRFVYTQAGKLLLNALASPSNHCSDTDLD